MYDAELLGRSDWFFMTGLALIAVFSHFRFSFNPLTAGAAYIRVFIFY